MVELARTWTEAQGQQLCGIELAGRYVVGAPLTRVGAVETYNATDLWLDRRVALAVDRVSVTDALTTTGKSVARISSPHVVDVFACGNVGAEGFVVFERPVFTVAFLARETWLYQWGDAQAVKAARELVIGLNDLHRAGIATKGLHLGSIGIDGVGRVRVSPWPIGCDTTDVQEAPDSGGDMALVASVLETGTRGDGSVGGSSAKDFAAWLRRAIGEGHTLTCEQLLEALAVVGVFPSGETADEFPPMGAVPFSANYHHIYHRRKRPRWPVAAGVGMLAALMALFFLMGPRPIPPASGARQTASCTSNGSKACSVLQATTSLPSPPKSPSLGRDVAKSASAQMPSTTTAPLIAPSPTPVTMAPVSTSTTTPLSSTTTSTSTNVSTTSTTSMTSTTPTTSTTSTTVPPTTTTTTSSVAPTGP